MTLKLLCQLRLLLSTFAVLYAGFLHADPLAQCPQITARVTCAQNIPTLEITRPARATDVTFRIGAIAQGSAMGDRMMTLVPDKDAAQMPLGTLPTSALSLAVVGTEGPQADTCCVRNIVVPAPDPALCAVPDAAPTTPDVDTPTAPEDQSDTQDTPRDVQTPDIALALTLQDDCPEGAAGHSCAGTLSLSVSGTPQGPFPLSLGHNGAENVDVALSGPLTCYATGPTSQMCREDAGILGTGLDLPLTLSAPWSYSARRVTVCAALELPQSPREVTYLVQTALNQIGLDAGPADGQSGPRTQAAVTALAARFGLQTDDPTDPALLALLGLTPYADGNAGNNRACATTLLPARPRPVFTPVPDVTDTAPQPRTPAPDVTPAPICDTASTVARAGECACRYDRMIRLSQRRCVCTATRGPPGAAGCP